MLAAPLRRHRIAVGGVFPASRGIHETPLLPHCLACVGLCAASALAADISGTRTGSFARSMNPGNVHYFVLDLKGDGTKLISTVGEH